MEGKGNKPNPPGKNNGWEWFNRIYQEALKPENRFTLFAMVGAGIGAMFLLNNDSRQEISWQEFRTHFLEQGKVRRDSNNEYTAPLHKNTYCTGEYLHVQK